MVFAFLGSLNKGFCCLAGCYEPVFLACYAVIRIDKHGFVCWIVELLQRFMGNAGFRIGCLIRVSYGFIHPIFVHSIRLVFSLSF